MRLMRWYAGLPIGIVGPHAVMAGVLVSAATGASWWALVVMAAPVLLWAGLQRA